MSFPLLLVARPDDSESWVNALRRSHDIELLAVIDLGAGGVEGIEDTLAASPDTAVAVVAKGPREASRLAERLVEHPSASLLHPAPAHPPLGAGKVQLTHGWLSLSGIAPLERLFASNSVESVRLTVNGLPEGRAPGLTPSLYHAMTLAGRLGRDVRIDRAVLKTEQDLNLRMSVDEVPWIVDVNTRGRQLKLTVRTSEGDYIWETDGVSESLRRSQAEPRVMPVQPWAERCIGQLLRPLRGGDLADARAARSLVDEAERSLERRLPPSRLFAESKELGIAAIGLHGVLPEAVPLVPTAPPAFELPLEAIAYSLELRPAVFLTVAPQDEARVCEKLPGAFVRRERNVQVGAGDRWDDDRTVGEPRIELFFAHDQHTAERLAKMQESDPSEWLSDIGALLGYPACCVQSFEAQGTRNDNSYNRVATAARTALGPGPWPAVLDDTSLKVLPHYSCTYRCERSFSQANDLLAALADEAPELRDKIVRYLGGPVLYFDDDHQLRFEGDAAQGSAVRYRAVRIPRAPNAGPISEPFARLAGAIAQGDRLVLTDVGLAVYKDEDRLFVLDRTDPGLGVLLPFSSEVAL